MEQPKATLGYWKIRGLAQSIRFLLEYTKTPFEDVYYEQGNSETGFNIDSWLAIKPNLGLDFPNLPYFFHGDVKLTQSNAILKYIARKHNLVGQNELEMALVDMLADQLMDFRNGFTRLCYGDFVANKDAYVVKVQGTLATFEKFLGDKQWLIGNQVTFPDFHFYELLDQHKVLKSDILEAFPKLQAYTARFEALPEIASYMKSDRFLARPLNNKIAGAGEFP